MTIDEIHWMTELFKCGKMSKAAEHLFITQPALSQCLQRIETQLGFRLFERSNKGLKPTPKGQLFYRASEEICEIYQQFLTQAEMLDHAKLQEITIGIAPFFSSYHSMEIIRTLRSHFPEIQFKIMESYTADLIEALRAGTIQIALIGEPLHPSNAVCHPIGKINCAIFLRRGSPLAREAYIENGKQYLDPAKLKSEPICVTKIGQSSRHIFDTIISQAGFKPNIIHESRHIRTLYQYAAEGISSSISIMYEEIVEEDRKQESSLLYRIPENYRFSSFQMLSCTMPYTEKLLPEGIHSILSQTIISNPATNIQPI